MAAVAWFLLGVAADVAQGDHADAAATIVLTGIPYTAVAEVSFKTCFRCTAFTEHSYVTGPCSSRKKESSSGYRG